MTQEQTSQSSLAFVLVKVNRRSKSVLAEARKQAVSKQEAIFRNFIQNQSICNTNNNHNTKNFQEFHQQLKPSPPKMLSPISVENAKYKEQCYSSYLNCQESKDQIDLHTYLNEYQDHSLPNKFIDQNHTDDVLLTPSKQYLQPLIKRTAEEDELANKRCQNQESSKQQSPQLLHQMNQHGNQQLNDGLEEDLPVFLQTYMKPYKQKSLSFYKQNLQHKKQISQKSDNNRLLQIWNDEDFHVKIMQNPHSTNGQSKFETIPKKGQLYNEVPVFLPKNTKLRRSFTKLAGFTPLQKQCMGEDIHIQNSQHQHQNNIQQKVGMHQNSNTSSKECLELGTISQHFDKSYITNKQYQKQQQQQQLITEGVQKGQNIRDKRSQSVKETTSNRRRTLQQNATGAAATQSGENTALQRILDIYSQPTTNKSNQKRFSNPEKISILQNLQNNKDNLGGNNISLTPMRQNKSFSIGSKQTPHQTIPQLAPNKLQLDDIPDASEQTNKILKQRQRHFTNLFNKLKQVNQKNSLQQQSHSSNNINNNSISSTSNNHINNFPVQTNNQLNTTSYNFQTTSSTAKQTVETAEDTSIIPYRYFERNSYFSATKAKLYENTHFEKPRLTHLESYRSNSPNRKKPQKRKAFNGFERGFTLKEFEETENQVDYNLNNYITEQRHIL